MYGNATPVSEENQTEYLDGHKTSAYLKVQIKFCVQRQFSSAYKQRNICGYAHRKICRFYSS